LMQEISCPTALLERGDNFLFHFCKKRVLIFQIFILTFYNR
jgi:hypothetical protein